MVSQPCQLVMRTGPTPNRIYPISKSEVIIGRETSADIVINDAEVSRKHARITMHESQYVLEDLGSTNGTFVAGQRLVGPYTLRPGDLILFGENISMSFEAVQYNAEATVVSTPGGVSTLPSAAPLPPAPAPVYEAPQPVYEPAPEPVYAAPAYVGQVPPGPMEVEAPPAAPAAKKGGGKTWIVVGAGCLVILLCVCVVGAIAYYIDSNNLWCAWLGPVFRIFGACK